MGIPNTKFVFRTRYWCNKIRRGKINEIISTSDGRFTAITSDLTGTNRRDALDLVMNNYIEEWVEL